MDEIIDFCLSYGFYPNGEIPKEDIKEVGIFLENLKHFEEEKGE